MLLTGRFKACVFRGQSVTAGVLAGTVGKRRPPRPEPLQLFFCLVAVAGICLLLYIAACLRLAIRLPTSCHCHQAPRMHDNRSREGSLEGNFAPQSKRVCMSCDPSAEATMSMLVCPLKLIHWTSRLYGLRPSLAAGAPDCGATTVGQCAHVLNVHLPCLCAGTSVQIAA